MTVNVRRAQREAAELTQTDAARRAGVSLATWRRWEEEPGSVKTVTRKACERVLDRQTAMREEHAADTERFLAAWGDCSSLTPRQAYSISLTLGTWADLYLGEWLTGDGAMNEPLHEVPPFTGLDLRVMVLVNESKAWAAKAKERCEVVAEEIANGVLPFDRPGCFFDELLMALVLPWAENQLTDGVKDGLFDGIPARDTVPPEADDGDDEDVAAYPMLDSEWDAVSDHFDDVSRWDEWEVPARNNHPLLAAIMAERHPFMWFDPGPGTGSGYMRRLVDQLLAARGVDAREVMDQVLASLVRGQDAEVDQ